MDTSKPVSEQEKQGNPTRADLVCHKCSRSFSFEARLKDRQENRVMQPGVTEFGIECPGCHNWTHVYWMSIQLDNQRRQLRQAQKVASQQRATRAQIIKYQNLKKKYAGAYGKFQNQMYKETGLKPVLAREHIIE